ncbi:MAG: AraC family transcriptional regulator, partial [Coriobacteriales bacterium]|nr:AraC family transcriptional regulator [Coriobacteriales bacterium]
TPDHIQSIFLALSEATSGSQSFYRLKTLELFHALQTMDMRVAEKRQTWLTKGQTMIAKQIYADIREDPQSPVAVSELSQRFGVSASSIRNYFRCVYGESIAAVLRRKRMENAARLLCETDLMVSEIAGAVGYENQSKFAAVFRAFADDAPLEYRRKMRCTDRSSLPQVIGD